MPREAEDPGETIFRMAVGFRNTQAIYVVSKLGIPDFLKEGPTTSDELALKLKVHPRSLFRVMRALAAQGVFSQDEFDRFGLTPLSNLLRSDHAESIRYIAIQYGEEHYGAAGDLMHTVKTGETAFNHLFGKGLFDYLAEHKEANETFNLFMAQSLRRSGHHLETYDLRGRRLLVDVGGGKGTMLAHILKSNPSLKGILYDLPQGVAGARGFLKAQGVVNRCRIVRGSFFDAIPTGGDVYLMSRILHDWPDERARLILTNCRKAIKVGGTLLIRDAVIPEGDLPSPGKQVDLTMLFMLGGVERTKKEWMSLLDGSGFALDSIVKAGQNFNLIEARPI